MRVQEKMRHIPFFIVSIVINMGANFAHPVTPTLFKSLGFGDYMFGYALAAMMIVNFLFSPFWGKMNSVFSSRICLFVSCAGYGVGQLLFGFASTELEVLLIRAMTGLFISGVFISMLNYIINVSENEVERSSHLVISATIKAVASAFGFLVGGLIGEIGIRHSFILQSIVLVLGGVFALLVCRDDRAEVRNALTIKGFLKDANPLAAFLSCKSFMTKAFFIFFVTVVLYAIAQTSFDQSFNYYITDQFKLSTGYNGLFKALMGVITLIANTTVCLYLIRKTDVLKSSAILFLLGAAALSVSVFVAVPGVFIAFSVLFFVFCSALLPLLQSTVAKSSPKGESNNVVGFFSAMQSLGGIVGALLSGTLYAADAILPFAMCIVAFLLGSAGMTVFQKITEKGNKG